MATISEKTIGNILILQVDEDPSTNTGATAPMGSLATILGVGNLWQKTGTGDTDWSIILAGTGIPVSIGSANAEGTADLAARSDHVHAHGDQAGGSLHSLATTSTAGFMSATDKTKLSGVLSGIVSAPTFSGNPKKATVTFGTVKSNTDYSITVTSADTRAWTFESKTVNGFVLNSNSNQALTGEVSWQVIDNYNY